MKLSPSLCGLSFSLLLLCSTIGRTHTTDTSEVTLEQIGASSRHRNLKDSTTTPPQGGLKQRALHHTSSGKGSKKSSKKSSSSSSDDCTFYFGEANPGLEVDGVFEKICGFPVLIIIRCTEDQDFYSGGAFPGLYYSYGSGREGVAYNFDDPNKELQISAVPSTSIEKTPEPNLIQATYVGQRIFINREGIEAEGDMPAGPSIVVFEGLVEMDLNTTINSLYQDYTFASANHVTDLCVALA